MDDYIKREDALAAQNKSMNLKEMRERLKCLPAADVAEVRHAEWAMTKGDKWNSPIPYCPVCGEHALFDGWRARKESNYCPNCGAKMTEV